MTLPFPQPSRTTKEPLTIDKLRSFPGCEQYSDEEAEEIVATIRALAKIVLQVASAHGTHYDNRAQGSIILSAQDNTVKKLAA